MLITMKRIGILLFLSICFILFQNCSGAHPKIPPHGLDVPFHDGHGEKNQCMQIAMQSVIQYFLNEVYTLDELDKVTGRQKGKWTAVSQGVLGLYELGLKAEAYCASDEPDFRVRYGRDAEKIIKNLDVAVANAYSEKAVENHLIQVKKLRFEDIEKDIEEGCVPIMIVDLNVLLDGASRSYNGHSVVVTGFDEEYVYYHEPGYFLFPSTPHKRVPKKLFLKAWNANGTDNCVIIVCGKREKPG